MSASNLVGFIAGGAVLIAFLGVTPTLLWRAKRGTPWMISERLLRGEPHVRRRTTFATGAWNPARSEGRHNPTVPARGTATYRLSAEGLVVLDLRTPDGSHEQFVGPVVPRPPAAGRSVNRALGVVVLVQAVAEITGATLGYTFGHAKAGPTLAGGALGLVMSPIFITIVTAFGRWRLRRGSHLGRGPKPSTEGHPNSALPHVQPRRRRGEPRT